MITLQHIFLGTVYIAGAIVVSVAALGCIAAIVVAYQDMKDRLDGL